MKIVHKAKKPKKLEIYAGQVVVDCHDNTYIVAVDFNGDEYNLVNLITGDTKYQDWKSEEDFAQKLTDDGYTDVEAELTVTNTEE